MIDFRGDQSSDSMWAVSVQELILCNCSRDDRFSCPMSRAKRPDIASCSLAKWEIKVVCYLLLGKLLRTSFTCIQGQIVITLHKEKQIILRQQQVQCGTLRSRLILQNGHIYSCLYTRQDGKNCMVHTCTIVNGNCFSVQLAIIFMPRLHSAEVIFFINLT